MTEIKTASIIELPDEIINIIISYLPNSFLIELKDFSILKKYALLELYSSVLITTHDINSSDFQTVRTHEQGISNDRFSADDYIPKFNDFEELVVFVKENNLPLPRYIYFRNPIDIISAHESHPGLMNNCLIQTTLKDLKYNGIDIAYINKLKNLPYTFDQLDDFYPVDESIYGDNKSWCKSLRRLEISFDADFVPGHFFSQIEFDNLIGLHVGPRILYEDIHYLPRSIKYLHCSIDLRGLGDTVDADDDIKLPNNLRTLYTNIRHNRDFSLDFRRMIFLSKLTFFSARCIGIDFPSSMRDLTVYSRLNMSNLRSQCQNLVCLCLNEVAGRFTSFPNSLKKLIVDIQALEYMVNFDVQLNHPVLPSGLEDLRIYGSNENIDEFSTFLNFDFSSLKHLKSLDLPFASGIQLETFSLKKLPKSITYLKLGNRGIKNLIGKFTELPYLQEIDLSDNRLVEYFSKDNDEFCDSRGNIFGPNIKIVSLCGNRITEAVFRLIIDDLMKKPHFQSLIVDEYIIPEDMKHLQQENYIIALR